MKRLLLLAFAGLAATGQAQAPSPRCTPESFSGEARFGTDAPIPLRITISCAAATPASLELQLSPRPVPLQNVTRDGDRLTLSGRFDGERLLIETRAEGDGFAGRVVLGDSTGTIRLRRGAGSAPVSLGPSEPELDLDPGQRRADLRALADGIASNHGNAFHSLRRADWRRAVGTLERRLASLAADQLPVAFLELTSLVGDGHTGVRLPSGSPRTPLGMMWFGSDLRVVRADARNADLLGARVVAIGGRPLAEVSHDILRLIPRGQNRWLFLSRSPRLLRRSDVLHYFGLARGDTVRIAAVRDDGTRVERSIALSPNVADAALTPVGGAFPLYQTRPGEALWWQTLRPGVVYIGFQSYDDLRTRSAALLAELDRDRPAKIILDMRDNPGGDFTLFRESLLAGILARPWLNRPERFYAIINRGLFSAAMVNAADLLTRTRVTVVGEPIGERPNEWAEVRFFDLPNSHITYGVSTRYYHAMPGNPEAVTPRFDVPARWEDFAAGRDTVLEWILARPAAAGTLSSDVGPCWARVAGASVTRAC